MKKQLFLILLLATLAVDSLAQSSSGLKQDFVIWNKASVIANKIDSSAFSAGAEFGYRRNQDAGTAQLYSALLFVGYEIPKTGLDLTSTYALVHFFTGSLNADLYQLAAGRSFHIKDSKFTPFGRLAVDKIIFPDDGALSRWRYRALAGTVYTISPAFFLKISDEFFLTHLTYNLHENRGQAGVYFNVIKHTVFGVSYFNRWAQQTNKPDLMEHTLLTEIIISI